MSYRKRHVSLKITLKVGTVSLEGGTFEDIITTADPTLPTGKVGHICAGSGTMSPEGDAINIITTDSALLTGNDGHIYAGSGAVSLEGDTTEGTITTDSVLLSDKVGHI